MSIEAMKKAELVQRAEDAFSRSEQAECDNGTCGQQTPLSKFVHSSEDDKAEVMKRVVDKAIEMQRKRLHKILTKTPQRNWVDLTDEEIRRLRKCNQGHDKFAAAIVKALKEKNT